MFRRLVIDKGLRFKVNILTFFERFFKADLYCYCKKSSKYKYDEVFPIMVASSVSELSGIDCGENFLGLMEERFKQGHRLFYCIDKGVLIAYGWLTGCTTTYYAWEIANTIHFDNPVMVLYDSFVNPSYRKRGIQKSLLHARINNCKEGTLLAVYAEPSNIPSNKAISSCGFTLVTKLTHFSNKVKRVDC